MENLIVGDEYVTLVKGCEELSLGYYSPKDNLTLVLDEEAKNTLIKIALVLTLKFEPTGVFSSLRELTLIGFSISVVNFCAPNLEDMKLSGVSVLKDSTFPKLLKTTIAFFYLKNFYP